MKNVVILTAAAALTVGMAQAMPAARGVIGHRAPVTPEYVTKQYRASGARIERQVPARRHGAPAKVSSRASDAPMEGLEVITEVPENATHKTYVRSGDAWGISGMYITETSADGCVVDVATTPDGEIYIGAAFSQSAGYYPMSYIVGDIKDGIATFDFPQPVFTGIYSDTDGSTFEDSDYAVIMNETEDEEGYLIMEYSENQTLKLKISDDGTITPVEGLGKGKWLGSMYYYEDEYYGSGWDWVGFGDDYALMTLLTETVAEIPADATSEVWNVIDGTHGYPATVATKGTDIYVRGIMETCPDGVMVGKIENGKAIFPSKQFVGISEADNVVYAIDAKMSVVNSPEYGVYETYVASGKDIVMAYNPEAGTLTSESTIAFSYLKDEVLLIQEAMVGTVICKPSGAGITKVAAPVIMLYEPYDTDYGEGLIAFYNSNVDGTEVIPADKFYFSIYFDDDVMTFEPDDYESLTEPTDMIPYGYTEYNIVTEGDLQGVYFFSEGYDKIGVQAIYKDGDKEVRSEITYIAADQSFENGIVNVGTAETVGSSYFDLQGRQIAAPAKGQIAVRMDRKADGTISASKIRF